jgi:growth factor-regulated tyrosine kinase substrate
MHEKLSQAVKLYDKLLTDQISHPAWRRTSPERGRASTVPTGPPNGYAQPQGPNGYNQWSPSFPVYASSQAPQSPTVQTSFQPSYAPPPPPLSSTSGPSYSHPSYAYNPTVEQEPHHQMISPPVLPVFSPPLQPFPSGAQASQGYQPVSILQAIPQTPPGEGGIDGPGQRLGAKSGLPPHESHPQPITQPAPTASAPDFLSHIPPTSTSPGRSTIARAHTITSRSSIASPPPPAQPHSSLARSTTVSYAPPAHARPQSFSRGQPVHTLQQPLHPPPPQPQLNPSLPAFPTVPTSTPQAFDLYAPSVPSAPPQERREEMLIEF